VRSGRWTPVHCGSWPAGDGGPPADQSPADVHRTLWERACPRWRPANRPVSFRCTRSTVGAGLPAMAACQPTNLLRMYTEPCGSGLARDGGLPADQSLSGVPGPLWELACQPTNLFLLPIDRSLRSAWECSQGHSAFHFCVERCVRNTELSHAFFRLPGRKRYV
jgi:hypothetical protein